MTNNILIIVDYQPQYNVLFSYNKKAFFSYVKRAFSKYDSILWFYNGENTCGQDSHIEMEDWVFKHIGLTSYLKYRSKITFFDKGCGYLFDLKNTYGFSDEEIVNIVDTSYQYKEIYNANSMEYEYSLPICNEVLIEACKNKQQIMVLGGQEEYCLWEVEIVLKVLRIKYKRKEEFIYQ